MNQNMCCQSRASPCSAGLKNWVQTSRSAISMPEAIATAGIEKITISETFSAAQTKSGILASVMPGARCLRMVATIDTEAASAATSVKVIICAQMSTLLPGENCGPESGT